MNCGPLRYVILEHDHPFLHWDLMLEDGPALRTWRLLAGPVPGRPVRATLLGAHRSAYLDYEGPVGGGRGTVHRWDAGRFTWLADEPDRVVVRLEGGRGTWLAVLRCGEVGDWLWTAEPVPVEGECQRG